MGRQTDSVVVCAADFGASGGKLSLVTLTDTKLQMQEVYRFSNTIVEKDGRLCWDMEYLTRQLVIGLKQAEKMSTYPIQSVAVDTWGFDVQLFKNGKGEAFPTCYRNPIKEDIKKKFNEKFSGDWLYSCTGIPASDKTTLIQLFQRGKSEIDFSHDDFLFLPDALLHFLCGWVGTEYTIASTSQLFSAKTRSWDKEICRFIFAESAFKRPITTSGTIVGKLRGWDHTKNLKNTVCIAGVGHDTAAAVMTIPTKEENAIYLLCGTWLLLGMETHKNYTTKEAQMEFLHNQGQPEGLHRLQRGITGLWILQQQKQAWEDIGKNYTYAKLDELAEKAMPFASVVDVDAPQFSMRGSMEQHIVNYCKETGQAIPENDGQIVLCIYNSLAHKCSAALLSLEQVTGICKEKMYCLGGGIRASCFMRVLAKITEKTVITSIAEASGLGNGLMQLIALGYIKDIKEGRDLVKQSFETQHYSETI